MSTNKKSRFKSMGNEEKEFFGTFFEVNLQLGKIVRLKEKAMKCKDCLKLGTLCPKHEAEYNQIFPK